MTRKASKATPVAKGGTVKGKDQPFSVPKWAMRGVLRVIPKEEIDKAEDLANRRSDLLPGSILLGYAAVDNKGERIFSDYEIITLQKRSESVVKGLVEMAQKTNPGILEQLTKGETNEQESSTG